MDPDHWRRGNIGCGRGREREEKREIPGKNKRKWGCVQQSVCVCVQKCVCKVQKCKKCVQGVVKVGGACACKAGHWETPVCKRSCLYKIVGRRREGEGSGSRY